MATDGVAADVDEGWRSSARSHPNSVPTAAPPQKQLQMYSPSPLADTDRSGYVSSAGGKLRTIRKSGRRNANPYERPAVGRHASAGPQAAVLISNGGVTAAQALAEKKRGAWLTGGLTKIIANSATYLYTSIFRRRLPAPVQVSNNEEEPATGEEQVSSPSAETNAAEPVSRSEDEEDLAEQEPSNNTLSEIERLLQRKTLSGEEYERLSALLRSRVVNNTTERKKQGSQLERASHQQNQPAVATQTEAQRWRQELQKSREERENGVRTLALYENGTPSSAVATPAVGAESMDGLNSSPVDVAIAFMGRRVVRPQGSTSPVEPLNRRDENLLSSGPPSLVMSQATLSKWTPPDFNDEEQFRTPAPPLTQTRSRAHNSLLRTPYSRPQRLQPSRERALDGTFGTPLSARWTPIRTPIVGGREMLKRRSTVLDDSYASVGPIRRTRQKAFNSPALATSARASAFPLPSASGPSVMTLPSSRRFPGPATNQKNAGPVAGQVKASLAVSGMSYVPVQSSETARKILETLEKMTPSPTGKSLEEELSYVRSRPPVTLTENMLNEHARRSMTVVDFTLPTGDSREPGPSGRTLNYDSPGLSQFDAGTKSSEPVVKTKGKGKSSASLPENGPSGLQPIQERNNSDAGLLEEVSVRTKDSDAVLASSSEKGRGFRMTAVFEESGSDDEGRLNSAAGVPSPMGVPTSSLTATSSKPATTSGKSVFTATAQVSAGGLFPRPATDSVGTTESPAAQAVDVSQISPPAQTQVTSSFTFPTRISLEGPPTPKAMSPASTSPKGAPAITPFFSFAANVPGASASAASRAKVEQTSTTVKSDTLTETKSDFTFGSTSIPGLSSQTISKVQATTEMKTPNLYNERSSLVGSSASSGLLTTLATMTSTVVAASTSAPPTSVPSGVKFGGTQSSAPFSSPFVKEGSTPSISSSPFGAATGSILFGAGGASTSSSTAAGLSSSLFGSSSGQGSSVSFSATGVAFGQSTSVSASLSSAPAVSSASEAQAVPARSTAGAASGEDRPQKRSAFSFDQESNRPQPSATTTLSQPFTTFGTSVISSAATTAAPVTFGAAFTSAPSSQNLFAAPTFGQPHRELQSSGASTPATSVAAVSAPAPAPTVSPSPFLFGAPPTTATASTQVSAAADTSTPSFASFTSSVFGSSSGGSMFGVTPPAPVSFGGAPSASAFGTTSSKPAFGGFATEAVSQSPSLPVFGSGFGAAPAQSPASTPAPAPTAAPVFSFGASSAPAPAFSFAASASTSSSGAAFGFGSTSSFAFGSTKTSPAAPAPTPSIFGLPSSVPAFGSTTNGTMTSDVVVNDHSNMEDSMSEEPPQVAAGIPAQQPSPFGGQSTATTGSFVFGAQAGAPAAAPPLFGFPGQPSPSGFGANPFASPNATQPPSGPLNFSGGAFNPGASGGDSGRTRKFIKAKRTGTKRGK